MADKDRLEILKQGVEVWNASRKGKPYDYPDLTNADLSNMDLRHCNLGFAELNSANLQNTNLGGAYISYAYLHETNLTDAHLTNTNLSHSEIIKSNFHGVDLSSTQFIESDLTGTDFSATRLLGTDFSRAILKAANFTGATFTYTIMGNTDLRGVIGLENAEHEGPSIIDPSTVARSGMLPTKFLRGCGVPDVFIDYLPSLVNEPIQFFSCFISYSSKDQVFAQRLHADLQDNGVRCWFAPEDLKIGDKTRFHIDESIRFHEKLLLVLSKSSVESEWVEKEVETAMEQERKLKRTILFPIRLDDAVMKVESGWPADIRRSRHIGNFKKWKDHDAYTKSFNRLLRDLSNK